jgi:peroxiredoxin
MANNKDSFRENWVSQELQLLSGGIEDWQPNISVGLAQLRAKVSVPASNLRWKMASLAAAVFCILFAAGLPSSKALAHRCLECSMAVWQSLTPTNHVGADLKPEGSRVPAPEFALRDANNKEVRLSDLKSKVVLVNFWATWCEGCQVEIPWFVEFQKKYETQGLAVVGISMDDDGWKSVKPWIREKKVNYSIVIGDVALGKQYGLQGMPLTVLVDRNGKIADVHAGVAERSATDEKIRKLLVKQQ